MACKEGQFDVVELMVQDFQYQFECSTCEWNDPFGFKTFSINLNVQNVNGMTPFDLALKVRLLDTLEK